MEHQAESSRSVHGSSYRLDRCRFKRDIELQQFLTQKWQISKCRTSTEPRVQRQYYQQAIHKPRDFLHVHASKEFYSHMKRPAHFNSDVFSGEKQNSCRYSVKGSLQNNVLRLSLSSCYILNQIPNHTVKAPTSECTVIQVLKCQQEAQK